MVRSFVKHAGAKNWVSVKNVMEQVILIRLLIPDIFLHKFHGVDLLVILIIHLINPAAFVAKTFTAIASRITPKNFRTAINPDMPRTFSIQFRERITRKITIRLARMANRIMYSFLS